MKRFSQYSIWVIGFIFVVGIIIVYKTFDNFSQITSFFGNIIIILKPFIIGFILAYLLNIPSRNLMNKLLSFKNKYISKYAKPISITTVYLVLILFVIVLIRMIVPAIYKNIVDMYQSLPYYIDLALQYAEKWELAGKLSILKIDETTITTKMQEYLASIDFTQFGKYAQGVINVTSGVISAFIAVIISIYMLIDKEQIKKLVIRVSYILFGMKFTKNLISYVKKVNDIFSKYIYCQLLDALIVATLSTIILSLFEVRYAVLLGILLGIFNLIPYFGAIIAIVITIVTTLFTGGWLKAIWTGFTLIIMQQVDGNVIGPRIMGHSLEIRPLWVIFAVTVGGGLFGVPGMILSVPILAMIKLILGDYLKLREDKIRSNNK